MLRPSASPTVPTAPDAGAEAALRRATVDALRVVLAVGAAHSALLLVIAVIDGVAAGELVLMAGWVVAWGAALRRPAAVAAVVARRGWALPAAALVALVPVALGAGFDSRTANEGLWLTWVAAVAVTPRWAVATAVAMTVGKLAAYAVGTPDVDRLFRERLDLVAIDASLPLLTVALALALAVTFRATVRRLGDALRVAREGGPATTPAMGALLSGRRATLLTAGRAADEGPPAGLPAGDDPGPSTAAHPDPLTPAQRAVVELLADGLRPKEIAVRRGVSLQTVRTQIRDAKRRTGARTIDGLVACTWRASA